MRKLFLLIAIVTMVGCAALTPSQQQAISTGSGAVSTGVQGAGVAATQPKVTPIEVIGAGVKAAEPFIPEPYRLIVDAILAIGAALFAKKAKDAASANASNTTALNTLAQTGQITVTPTAPGIANGIVDAHPASDALIDALSDAAKTPRIQ